MRAALLVHVCWSNKPESTSFYFALRHAHAFSFARQVDYHQSPATTGGRRGRRHYSYCTSCARTEAVAFILSAETPTLKSGPLYADVRANAEAAAARAPPRPSVVPAPPPPPAADEEDAMPPGSSSSTSTQTQFLDCPGVVLAVPSPGCENYPFQLHSHLSSSTSTRWQSTLRWSTRVMSPRRSFQK